ncbi:kinesin-like protein KIF26B isoform X2 [Trichomycterus rosablanca]|uniref:kinesin-like protein KIF26B isoform X2 n=1 Tax=Trichomycterus rosablanca TaxID=2290929 RepID=UPI002F359C87
MMSSLSGSKDRSVRSRKLTMSDSSPTKSSSVSPDSWYRKACEESRSGIRPVPEGARSIPGSSGAPSPGSGTSSPGSFSGSPGPVSPGIGTSSPGSLGGSPGFGTGSPASGSGSSPGSERGTWCETCNGRLGELKRQAAKLLLPGPYSSKDPSLSFLLHDKLQVSGGPRKAWNERESRCDVCLTHLSQLKQEAVRLVLTCDVSPGSPPSLASLVGSRSVAQGSAPPFLPGSFHPSTSCSPPAPSGSAASSPLHAKHGAKPNTLGVERRGGSQTQPDNSGSPAHPSRSNGVTLFPYQVSDVTDKAVNETPAPPITAPPTGTSAAASFFARAAQKLNLTSKKKKQKPTPPAPLAPPLFPTNFGGILQVTPPPAPPCLLRAVSKVRDNPGLGKVKVMLRVCPSSLTGPAESSSFLKVDSHKKQVTIMDPSTNSQQNQSQKRGAAGQGPPKMFGFDAAFSHDASQVEVCAGTVAEVIQSVVNGADGCVFCFGHAKLGKTYTMIGKDDSMQNLGIIPCAISWLFKIIDERKEKTGARFSVRVSAVEVWGRDENLKDLLSDVATGSLQDGQSPGVYLCEDPICGMQLQNQSELRAPTPEKAAFYLDAAIAARYSSRAEYDEEEHRNSHMLFTLHIYQYRMEKNSKGGSGRSRLHLIDLGSCMKEPSKSRENPESSPCLSLSALGNVILALVDGSKHIPYKDSKLTMLLRESLGNMNCRTTMIALISSSPAHFSQTLSTLQIASRLLRMKKKKTKVTMQYTSSSSGGESSCEEGRMRRPTQLRNIHSRNVGESGMSLLHLSSDPDEHSSSEQSCDTVIYVAPDGSALSDKELTDNEGPPEFVPIPSLHQNTTDTDGVLQQSQMVPTLIQPPPPVQPVQSLHSQSLPPVPEEGGESDKQEKDCLKCNTFAELQERLGCIDGSEEVNTYHFEEVPASRITNTEPQSISGSPERISNDQQLEEIREVVEEAEIAQSIIESLAKSSINSRTVAGCGGIGQLTSLQRAKSSSLHNSRESISGGSLSESKPRPMGSPRLGIASLTKTADYKPPSSPSQRCKVYTQKGVMPSTPPHSSQNLHQELGKSSTESLLQPESRTSPVGMSPQVLQRSSLSNSLGSIETLSDDVPQLPLDSKKSTMFTLQQSLETIGDGEDKSVFTPIKDLSGIMENSRPTSIISFNSDCSVQALDSGSRPLSIISSISEDLECFSRIMSATTATISEANIARFIPQSKAEGEGSERSSVGSWLSEMSTGSDREPSCHSVVAQQCFGQGEGPAEVQLLEITEEEDVDKNVETMFRVSPTTAKATITVSSVRTLSTFSSRTNVTAQPYAAVKPIVHHSSSSLNNPRSLPASLSSKITFDDPWMKKETNNESSPEKPENQSDPVMSNSVFERPTSGRVDAASSPDTFKRVVDGCEMVINTSETISPVFSVDLLRTGSLPRGWHRLNKQDDLDEFSFRGEFKSLGVTSSTPCSPRATLERRGSSGRPGFFTRQKGLPPLPPVRKSSLDQRNRAGLQHNPNLSFLGSSPEDLGKQRTPSSESSRLFSAKLEHLASRTNSLGRSHGAHYDCYSLEKADSLTSVGSRASSVRDSTMPRLGRSLTRNSTFSPTNGPNSNLSPKASPSKISAVTKLLMASPKSRSFSTSSTRTLSFSTKSLPKSDSRSSSLPPNGKNLNQNSWSTQSLSRSRGSGLASKLPLRAVNGRISELLQGSAGQAGHGRGASSAEEKGGGGERSLVHTLPSPYSKITAPRRPHRCSSGHASDNSSVLSGELPPAMGKTALFYHSGGSSGYESMIRDSEATGSASSTQDSMSDNSSSVSSRRSLKISKKRNNTGNQRRRLIPNLTLDPTSPVRKPILSPGALWVDGPLRPPQRGAAEPFEIKVYEIDDVERLQRRRTAESKGVFVSAKLQILEHRQQRISELRSKYQNLQRELELTKQHLMIQPHKWTSDFDVQQTLALDSLEYLEELESVTERLESCLNFCKAHLMMVTCFDVTSRRR